MVNKIIVFDDSTREVLCAINLPTLLHGNIFENKKMLIYWTMRWSPPHKTTLQIGWRRYYGLSHPKFIAFIKNIHDRIPLSALKLKFHNTTQVSVRHRNRPHMHTHLRKSQIQIKLITSTTSLSLLSSSFNCRKYEKWRRQLTTTTSHGYFHGRHLHWRKIFV